MTLEETIRSDELAKIKNEIERFKSSIKNEVNRISGSKLSSYENGKFIYAPEYQGFLLALDKFCDDLRAAALPRLDWAVHSFYVKVMDLPDRKPTPNPQATA